MDILFGLLIFVGVVIVFFWLFDNVKTRYNENDDLEFTSSFARGGNMFFPSKLIFGEHNITYVKNHGFFEWFYTSVTTYTIPYHKVTGIEIERNIIGCNIKIIGNGVQNIYATSHSGKQADMIEGIYELIQKEFK